MLGEAPLQGMVIDAGEPAGKKNNDSDFFEIIVLDPISLAAVFFASANSMAATSSFTPPTGH